MSHRPQRDISFYAARAGSSRRHHKLLHIETDGAIVNINVGLTDDQGRHVTRVDVLPDDERRGGDGEGQIWRQDGPRLIRVGHREDAAAFDDGRAPSPSSFDLSAARGLLNDYLAEPDDHPTSAERVDAMAWALGYALREIETLRGQR
jgi:hypothetical protein